jgi:hypothetical protein
MGGFSVVEHLEAADILRQGTTVGDWRQVFGDYIKRSSPTLRSSAQSQLHKEALDDIHDALEKAAAEDARRDFDSGNRRREAVLATRAKHQRNQNKCSGNQT